MLVEYVFGMWFKFDMKGFTQQQMLSMNSYERLLIELGEKNYVETESSWPVEARLLSMIVINAVVFLVSKMVFNKTGANLLNMMNSISGIGGDNKSSNFSSNIFSQTTNNTVKEEKVAPENKNETKTEGTMNNIFSQKKKMKGPNVDLNEFTFISEEEAKKKNN